MDAPQPQAQTKQKIAWQPLTFSGAGRFAVAPLGRLWLVQFLFSLIIAAVVVWFVDVDWFPVVARAARRLAPGSEIRGGRLAWQGEPAMLLAENRFFAIAVDENHTGQARSPAHVSVELGFSDYKVFSLLGYLQWPYPRHWIISLTHDDMVPWWGAWSPVILAAVAASTSGVLMFVWTLLSTIYFLPLWLLAFFTNREISPRECWRLAGAAQMPGALWFAAAILVYGLGWFGLVGFALTFAAHLIVGLVYLIGSVLKLPTAREAADLRHNPFAAKREDPPSQGPMENRQIPNQTAGPASDQAAPLPRQSTLQDGEKPRQQ